MGLGVALYGGMRTCEREGRGERTGRSRGWGRAVGTKQRSLAHILLCILLFWLANIQDGRPAVILGWRRDVRVLARARGRARVNKRVCIRAYRLYIYYIIYIHTHLHVHTYISVYIYPRCMLVCTGNSVYQAMHGAMHIYARDNSHWRSLGLLEVY